MLSLLLLLLGVRAGAARIPGQIPADGIAGINVDGSASVVSGALDCGHILGGLPEDQVHWSGQ